VSEREKSRPCVFHVGTSGYNYPEWKGSFYPADLSTAKMLRYYGERFDTVEINYTFYRVPNEKILAAWVPQTPERFKFTLKAPRRITHINKLRGSADLVSYFCKTAATLGPKLGVLLFQLAPSFRKDVAALDELFEALPEGTRATFEFRHASWHDDEVFGRLARRNLALCVADSERMSTPVTLTADYGYFRLRDEGYGASDIAQWADLMAERCRDLGEVFVYFKHEEQGKGPEFAKLLIEELARRA
jgi:uncharacterized protein YecE (DUF72 family)